MERRPPRSLPRRPSKCISPRSKWCRSSRWATTRSASCGATGTAPESTRSSISGASALVRNAGECRLSHTGTPARRDEEGSLRAANCFGERPVHAMKAGAVFPAQRRVEVVALDEPTISSPNQVKLRVLEVGVCGTDREICRFHYGTPPEGSDFLVLGHESLGEVVETGSAVTRVRCGDLVTPMVRHACPHGACVACRSGYQDYCSTGDFRERGIKQLHGFMTSFVLDDEKYVHPVPRELRDVAILVEPLTIAEKALLQIRAIERRLPWNAALDQTNGRGCAVVLGAGPVGLLGAMALVNAGYRTIIYSREPANEARAALAGSFGAQYVPSQEQPIAQLAALAGNIDVIYEATGASQTAFDMLEVLGANGVYVLTGVPRHSGPVSIQAERLARNLVLKNQTILGTVNAGRQAFEAAIHDLGIFYRRWPAAVRALITRRYTLDRFTEPVLEAPGIKNIIVLDGN